MALLLFLLSVVYASGPPSPCPDFSVPACEPQDLSGDGVCYDYAPNFHGRGVRRIPLKIWQVKRLKAKILQSIKEASQFDVVPGDHVAALVRLSFHDAASFSPGKSQSGVHGCILVPCAGRNKCQRNMDDNKGMEQQIQWLLHEYRRLRLRHKMSKADFLHLCSIVAIEYASGDNLIIPFKAGRRDCDAPTAYCDALPDTGLGRSEARRVFERLGFTETESLTLLGAHTLGRCERINSGYERQWVQNPAVFDSDYYKEILEHEWIRETTIEGKHQWQNSLMDVNFEEFHMMLNVDLGLIFDIEDRKCSVPAHHHVGEGEAPSNLYGEGKCKKALCSDNFETARLYAEDNAAWLGAFVKVYTKLISLGAGPLYYPTGNVRYLKNLLQDDDKDGTFNIFDKCPSDPLYIASSKCGCGEQETDVNLNDVLDCLEPEEEQSEEHEPEEEPEEEEPEEDEPEEHEPEEEEPEDHEPEEEEPEEEEEEAGSTAEETPASPPDCNCDWTGYNKQNCGNDHGSQCYAACCQ